MASHRSASHHIVFYFFTSHDSRCVLHYGDEMKRHPSRRTRDRSIDRIASIDALIDARDADDDDDADDAES